MIRLASLGAFVLALAACSTVNVPPAPAEADVRPIVAKDELQGRWTIISVNGQQVDGLWLELGGEGLATITKTENAIFVASPQPPTRAHLGCNEWYPSGWTRNGDKLTLGLEMSRRTERGCDAAREALDDEAYAILRQRMTMELIPSSRLRLINEMGSLELVRMITRGGAIAFIENNVHAGDSLSEAIDLLVRGGFACRRLARHEYGPAGPDGLGPKEITSTMCHVATERSAEGYQLVYANLSADPEERIVSIGAGSYPVVYRNLRTDDQGKVTVVPDPSR